VKQEANETRDGDDEQMKIPQEQQQQSTDVKTDGDASVVKGTLRLEHLAAVVSDVQHLADIVMSLRRRRQEKLRQSLDNEAEAEGDLFPRAMLEAAAGAVEESGGAAAAPSPAGVLLNEPFWTKHKVSERLSSATRMRRLERRDALTKELTAADYLLWAEAAKISFTKPRQRKKFAAWAGLEGAHAPFVVSKELMDVLGQLTYEHIEGIVTGAVLDRSFPVLTVADLPPADAAAVVPAAAASSSNAAK
jgi:hypothetical protein